MEVYDKRLKKLVLIGIILYIFFFVWILYFKCGRFDYLRFVAGHLPGTVRCNTAGDKTEEITALVSRGVQVTLCDSFLLDTCPSTKLSSSQLL